MRIRRGGAGLGRTPGFAASALLHLAVVLVVALSPVAPAKDPRPLYNQEIRPYQSHLIWYNLRKKLPEVKPAEAADAKPPRAFRRFQQQIVARQIELLRPPQLIRVPAPEIPLAQPLKLPNLLAVAPPRPVRPFAPPERARPPEERPLPAAPQIHDAVSPRELALDLAAPRPRPLPFIPPVPRQSEPALSALPAAPVVAVAAPTANMPRIPRGFSAPPEKKAKPAAATTEPALPTDGAPVVVPPSSQSTLAIVGLTPIDTPVIPKPPGSHEAGFSAGPHPKLEGAAAAPASAAVVVPDLMAHGGAQDASAAVLAVLRPLTRERIVAEVMADRAGAQPPAAAESTRTVKAPDPRLEGRAVYTISIQMPNVTSFSGSWLVWFAERRSPAGSPPADIESPVALRKVDPKYYSDAVYDRVEGTVRLFAVIRKDGQVDAIEILRGIDKRLDRSAAEALAKWQFEPAKRAGEPVDVDAVFEVPFRLAPRSERRSEK
ncbi:MAG: TonB family protein [Bryobacteraceae bacterium]